MGCGRTLAQHGVSPFWHILDLDTWHSAIMAPLALKRNRTQGGRKCAETSATGRPRAAAAWWMVRLIRVTYGTLARPRKP